jgi:predicted kinase
VADSVNPLACTRDAWVEVAKRARVNAVEIEVKCSDLIEHRRRVETRASDISRFRLPTWEEVLSREYQPWNREHLVIDTADCAVEKSVRVIRDLLGTRESMSLPTK